MHRAVPPPAEPGARRSLLVLLRGGPAAQAIGRADLRLYRLIRSAARPPALDAVGRFSQLGEHAAGWLVLGAVGMAAGPRRPRRRRGGPLALGGGQAPDPPVP